MEGGAPSPPDCWCENLRQTKWPEPRAAGCSRASAKRGSKEERPATESALRRSAATPEWQRFDLGNSPCVVRRSPDRGATEGLPNGAVSPALRDAPNGDRNNPGSKWGDDGSRTAEVCLSAGPHPERCRRDCGLSRAPLSLQGIELPRKTNKLQKNLLRSGQKYV